jgi:hypothetical protein
MSIADNFGQESNAGFVRAYDPRATRRQFQVSMMLVFVLALAAFALGLLAQLDWLAAMGRSSTIQPGSTHVAETLLDIRG